MIAAHLSDLAPIYSLEAEMSALGSMLLSERAAEEIVSILHEDDFYNPSHREIFRSMVDLLRSSKPIDLITLRNELMAREKFGDVGGDDYLMQIAEVVPSAANATYYAQIVLDKATLRRLEGAGRDIVHTVHASDGASADSKVDTAEQLVFDVGRKRLGKYFAHVRTLAKEFFVDVDSIFESQEPILGTPTKFPDLDAKLTGLYGGDLHILAARPSMGKTTLALDIALRVAKQQVGNVAIFSLEMGDIQLVRRLVSMESGISQYVLKRPGLSQEDYHALADGVDRLYNLPIYIDDSSSVTPLGLRGKCRRLKADGGLALIVVDYLQLMHGGGRSENRVQEISDIARALKATAKELDVPIIALSQLNRAVEQRDNKRPQLSDIRESGSIEAEADVVMMLYRGEYYGARTDPTYIPPEPGHVEVAEVNIAKHRNGEVGVVLLGFQPSCVKFHSLDERSKSDYSAKLKEQEYPRRGRGGDHSD